MSAMVPLHITRFLRRLAALRGSKGGIMVLDADGLPAIFPLGTDTYAVVADKSKELGLDYQAGGGGGVSSVNGKSGVVTLAAADVQAVALSTVTTKGDLIVATGAGAVTRLAAPADGSIIVADSTAGGGWKTSTLAAAGAALAATKINATAPMTIAGGSSADLSTDRTIAISAATTTTQGSVELADDGEATSAVVPTGADTRLLRSAWLTILPGNNVAQTNMPAAFQEFLNGVLAWPRMDSRPYNRITLHLHIGGVAPVSGARYSVQYSVDNGTNWRNLDVGSGSSAAIGGLIITNAPWSTSTRYISSAYAANAAAFAAGTMFRVVNDGGDGVVDPTNRGLGIEFTRV